MSKNLEKEYKELMSENVPDLWERIEAGLEPKQPTDERMSLWRKYRVWGGVAVAACFCLVLSIPVIFGRVEGDSNNAPPMSGGATAGNMSAAENAGTASNAPAEDVGMAERNEAFDAGHEASASAAEASATLYIVMGIVTEVSEAGDGTSYLVEIEYTDITGLSGGDEIRLYAEGSLEKELAVGEEYGFDILISIDDNGETEYLIDDVY